MQKQRSDEGAVPRLARTLALAGLPGAAAPTTPGRGAATSAAMADASPGATSSVTEVDPIDVSDGDFFETFHVVDAPVTERNKDAAAAVVVIDDDCSVTPMAAHMGRLDGVPAVFDTGHATSPTAEEAPPVTLQTPALAGSSDVVSSSASAAAAADVATVAAVAIRSSGASVLVHEDVAADAAAALLPAEPPAKLPRTRWGRCGLRACQAPLRLLVDNAQGRPFLGCSRWKASSPGSCTFSTGFPEDRRDELPLRMRSLRRITW